MLRTVFSPQGRSCVTLGESSVIWVHHRRAHPLCNHIMFHHPKMSPMPLAYRLLKAQSKRQVLRRIMWVRQATYLVLCMLPSSSPFFTLEVFDLVVWCVTCLIPAIAFGRCLAAPGFGFPSNLDAGV